MIVVSDTSPLRYLVLIQVVDVLPQLFGEVIIPPVVAAELTHPKTPVAVRQWFNSNPQWLKVQTPTNVQPIRRLNRGEVEAIALALEVQADQLLIDDNAGKKAAMRLGISAVGTLAILDLAAKRRIIDFRKAITALESGTNFRMPQRLRDQLLRDHKPLDEVT